MPAERIPTVLMLDDEKFLLEMYKIALEKRGFEVSAFHRADDALNALRAGFDPDIILFDITIPDSRSGYEFLEIIRKEQLAKSKDGLVTLQAEKNNKVGQVVEVLDIAKQAGAKKVAILNKLEDKPAEAPPTAEKPR